MIRPAVETEIDALKAIAAGTQVFKPIEIDSLGDVLYDYFDMNYRIGHRAIAYEENGKAIGFAYYAPTPMTENTWYIHWIYVDKQTQSKGIGTKLLDFLEEEIKAAGGRLLLIETSSLPSYEPTHHFYLNRHFEKAALIRDFYADGDDLVVFRKRFNPNPAG